MFFRLRWTALVGLMLVSAGCGEKLAGPQIDIPFPIDTTRPGGNPGGGRTAALDLVQTMVASLPGQNHEADTQLLVTLLRAMPQFAAAGASADGTVWARFPDGVTLMVVQGGPLTGNEGTASAARALPAPLDPRASASLRAADALPPTTTSFAKLAGITSAQTTAGTVPRSEKYRLLNGIGNFFEGDPRSDIASMLNNKGYTGKFVDGTLGELRQVSGDGIFYMRSHGGLGSFQRDGTTRDMYALWTATAALDSAAEARDTQLMEDLRQQRVVYMLFRASRWTQAIPALGPNRHYGITEAFISHYMSFADNSLIYIDACQGAMYPSFRAAFKNASVFMGWSERAAFSSMGVTAKFMFDRMLGANTFAPETPHQRPFDYDALSRDPKFGVNKPFGYSTWTAKDGGTIRAELTFNKMAGDFGILAPSIMMAGVVERLDEVTLIGIFGPDPGRSDGKVTIDDGNGPVSVPVKSWAPDLITLDMPRKGGGSSGNIVVSVRNHKSNPRQLLAWEGTFNYESDDTGMKQKFDMDMRARADIHDVRLSPGTAPVKNPGGAFDMNADTEARYSATGSFSQAIGMCTATETWAGAGTIPATPTGNSSGKNFVFAGHFDAPAKKAELVIAAADNRGISRAVRLVCPLSTTSSTDDIGAVVSILVMDRQPNGNRALNLQLDDGMNIVNGSRRVPFSSSYVSNGSGTLTLNWPTIRTKPRYDPDIAR